MLRARRAACGAGGSFRLAFLALIGMFLMTASEPASAQDLGGIPPGSGRLPLTTAQSLQSGQRLYNETGSHFLVLNPDGNLVVARADGGYVWGFDTQPNVDHTRVGRVDWQQDGNLAAYDANGGYLWSALTENSDANARLVLQPNGALQVVSPSRGVLWSSDGNRSAPAPAVNPTPAPTPGNPAAPETVGQGFPFRAGEMLAKGVEYRSGDHVVILQDIGNLVLATASGGYRWGFDRLSGLNFRDVDKVGVSAGGNLVAYNSDGTVIWRALPSDPGPNTTLQLINAGAMQLVAGNGDVLWSTDGILARSIDVFKMAPPVAPCTPDAGWSKCLMLNDPQIKIQGTNAVSQSAMNGVANVYAEITARLTPRYPRNEFNGFGVFITNGESLDQLNALDPIRDVHADGYPGTDGRGGGTRNTLRGGACCDFAEDRSAYVWISEQMICKEGVRTHNEDVQSGRVGGDQDFTPRTVDQVIHEFGHSIDQEFGLRANRLRGLYPEPIEGFAQSVHYFFGAPPRELTGPQMALMNEMFTSQARFSCDGYNPSR